MAGALPRKGYRLDFDLGQLCKVSGQEMFTEPWPTVPHNRGTDRAYELRELSRECF